MNAIDRNHAASSSHDLELDHDRDFDVDDLPRRKPANDVRRKPAGDLDPFTRGYRRHTRKLRAACARYVGRDDVADLVQDIWTVAAQHPAKLAQSDSRTLSWLIGVAKRCAPTYDSAKVRTVPIDELLAGESGDDLDGRAMHEDVTEMRVEMWGKDD